MILSIILITIIIGAYKLLTMDTRSYSKTMFNKEQKRKQIIKEVLQEGKKGQSQHWNNNGYRYN